MGINYEELTKQITSECQGMSINAISKKLGVSRATVKKALEKIHENAYEQDDTVEEVEQEVTITSTDNGCVSYTPAKRAPAVVGDIFEWGKNRDILAIVTRVEVESKVLWFARIKFQNNRIQQTDAVTMCKFSGWRKKKAQFLKSNVDLERAQKMAVEKTSYDLKDVQRSLGPNFENTWLDIFSEELKPIEGVEETPDEIVVKIQSSAKKKLETIPEPVKCPYRLIVSERSITIFPTKSQSLVVTSDQGDIFTNALECVNSNDWDALLSVMKNRTESSDNIKKFLKEFGFEFKAGFVEMVNNTGKIKLNGLDVILKRMENYSKKGNPEGVRGLCRFIDKITENPDQEVIDKVVEFVRYSDIEIDSDGDLICYKVVDANYKDAYTRKLDNSPGSLVKMKRLLIDTDSNKTCSQGLHVCSLGYVPKYGSAAKIDSYGSRLVTCKLNPTNIVTIPNDYNGKKIRCCEYLVLKDVTSDYRSGKLKADHAGAFSSKKE